MLQLTREAIQRSAKKQGVDEMVVREALNRIHDLRELQNVMRDPKAFFARQQLTRDSVKAKLQRLIEERNLRAALEANLQKVQFELQAARRAALDGVGQEHEKQRLLELKLQEEKDKRIAHLQQSAMRRIAMGEVSRGWNAWYEFYSEKLRMMRLVRGAASRLQKPALGNAFHHWLRISSAEKAMQATMTAQQKFDNEVAQHNQREAEIVAWCDQSSGNYTPVTKQS